MGIQNQAIEDGHTEQDRRDPRGRARGRNRTVVRSKERSGSRACDEWIWEHPEKSAEMGRAGRKLAEEVFGKERHCEQVMSIYKKVGRCH